MSETVGNKGNMDENEHGGEPGSDGGYGEVLCG